MFISNNEKRFINVQISSLQATLAEANKRTYDLTVRLDALEKSLEKKPKVKRVLTNEQKAQQAEYMKKYNARKKAEKAAQLQQVIV